MSGALAIPLSTKVTAKVVRKLAPIVLGKLPISNELISPVCNTIKTIACKHEILTAHALNLAVPEFAAFSKRFMQMLNESVQVSIQSSCKNYELIVGIVASDPKLSTSEKVNLVCEIERNRTQNLNSTISTVGTVITSVGAAAVPIIIAAGKVINPKEHMKEVQAVTKAVAQVAKEVAKITLKKK